MEKDEKNEKQRQQADTMIHFQQLLFTTVKRLPITQQLFSRRMCLFTVIMMRQQGDEEKYTMCFETCG